MRKLLRRRRYQDRDALYARPLRALRGVQRKALQPRDAGSEVPGQEHPRALEKEMATHSSVLAWRIPGMGAWWATVYGVTQSRT